MNRTVPVVLYRAAAVLLVLFAAGHTFGFLSFRPSTPDGRAVFASMASVTFPAGNRLSSYAQFYEGFGLSLSAYLSFLAYLAWYLGSRVKHRRASADDSLPWMFVALQSTTLVLGIVYFSIAPAVFSAVTLVLVSTAAWLARGDARREPA